MLAASGDLAGGDDELALNAEATTDAGMSISVVDPQRLITLITGPCE